MNDAGTMKRRSTRSIRSTAAIAATVLIMAPHTTAHRMLGLLLESAACTQAAAMVMGTRSTSIGAAAEEVAALHLAATQTKVIL